jgi:uncharacterized membrane protein (DUF485 family)
VGFVTYLPLLLIWTIALVAGGKTFLLASLQGSLVITIAMAFVNTVFLVLSASVMAWLYRRFANALLEQVAY